MSAGLLGVGFLGAGPVTQAIHLPTLATMPDLFRPVRVMDVDRSLAERVASRCGARVSTDAAEVLADPAVEIVAVCSPNNFHADQVVAACEAGKRAVVCEKPLAVSREESARITTVAAATGTHVLVGAMHVYDPAYRDARAAWVDLGESTSFVQSTIFLPSNDFFINQATDQAMPAPGPPSAPGSPEDPVFQAMMLRFAILGLAIHNLPLIRDLFPSIGHLQAARLLPPFGYAMVTTDGDRSAELIAYMGGAWPPHWTFRAIGDAHELWITFPPSYVLAGSARAEVVGKESTTAFEHELNGYQAQWRHLHAVVRGEQPPLVPVRQAADDVVFALDLADQVDAVLVPAP